MLKFKTQYDAHEHVYSDCGSRIKPTYALATDENGVLDLKQKGTVDIYEEIQSHADSVDIHVILERFKNGDESVLNKTHGIFTDITEMPKTFAELYQKVIDAEEYFNGLPLEIRDEFNQSPSEFFASIGTDKFNDVFKAFNKTLEAEKLENDVIPQIDEKGDVK